MTESNPPAVPKTTDAKSGGSDTVPVSDLLAVKSALEKSEERIASLTQDVAARESRIRELESLTGKTPEADELLRLQKANYDQRKELLAEQRRLAEKEEQLTQKERTSLVSTIAAEFKDYGIEAKELVNFKTEAEMRAYASEKALKNLNKAKPQPGKGKYETPSSHQSAGNDIVSMSDKDFETYWANQRKLALARR